MTCRVPNSQVIHLEAAGMDKVPCQTDSTQARNTCQCGGRAALAISWTTCACVTGTGLSSHTYEASNLQLSAVTCWQRGEELGCFLHVPCFLAAIDSGTVPVRPDGFGSTGCLSCPREAAQVSPGWWPTPRWPLPGCHSWGSPQRLLFKSNGYYRHLIVISPLKEQRSFLWNVLGDSFPSGT